MSSVSIQLRPWTPTDLPVLLRALQQPSLHQNLRRSRPETTPVLTLAITLDQKTVGGISFDTTETPGTLEVGFWILSEHEGKGIMTQAVSQSCRDLLARENIQTLRAQIYNGHPSSARVLEKSGFQKAAHLPGALSYGGAPVDVTIFTFEL